ncbi:LysR family transcriptional regulator [Tritonibacter horizontis]|uniref:HTH-type transcriptional regulator DmlR n=1 Tax=Tritonibacter horizontis TaxID=1768241 RepID=A0A132C1C9_9RHOB|nr:LysR family transcriptional regulator [Tritonibacter horizontis]KUP94425.1 HTH-type transcriptional regulator DmlR [Tritonibacter horizontis]
MDLLQYKTLLAVARHGSFAAAARALEQDPSVVSRTVAAAEAHLGVRLFERSTRRLAITGVGQGYLDRIAPLVEELEQAAEEARSARRAPSGRLRITASVAYGQECLVPLLPRFRADYPDIALDLIFTDGNLDLLAEGIDLAIRLAPAPQGDLISTRLRRTRYHVCAAPAYLSAKRRPRDPQELRTHDCLRMPLPGYDSTWRFRNGTGEEVHVPVAGSVVISSPLALREAARAALGPALLADWLVKEDLAQGRLVPLFDGWEATATGFDTGAWALYPSRNYMPARLRLMLDFLKQHDR